MRIAEQESEIQDVKRRVTALESENNHDELNKLRTDMNELEQYNRRNNIEIHGVEQTVKEDLFKK